MQHSSNIPPQTKPWGNSKQKQQRPKQTNRKQPISSSEVGKEPACEKFRPEGLTNLVSKCVAAVLSPDCCILDSVPCWCHALHVSDDVHGLAYKYWGQGTRSNSSEQPQMHVFIIWHQCSTCDSGTQGHSNHWLSKLTQTKNTQKTDEVWTLLLAAPSRGSQRSQHRCLRGTVLSCVASAKNQALLPCGCCCYQTTSNKKT